MTAVYVIQADGGPVKIGIAILPSDAARQIGRAFVQFEDRLATAPEWQEAQAKLRKGSADFERAAAPLIADFYSRMQALTTVGR